MGAIVDRKREPVVIRAGEDGVARFPAWVNQGVPTKNIEVWSYDASTGWTIIPHQVDDIADALVQLSAYQDTDHCNSQHLPPDLPDPNTVPGPCEESYDLRGTAEPNGVFSVRDEIVFIAGDGGACDAPTTVWPGSNLDSIRYRIELSDSPASGTETGCVYLFRRMSGTRPAITDLVSYDETGDGEPATCRPTGEPACGAIIGQSYDVDGGGTDIPAYRWDFLGNWSVNKWFIGETNTSTSAEDVIDRLKTRIESPRETEEVWDLLNPTLGGCAYFHGYIDGPVRVVREIQGAASGILTTKYEFAYPGEVHQLAYLRVHEVDGPLELWADHDSTNVSSIADTLHPDCGQGGTDTCAEIDVNGSLYDQIDGAGPAESNVENDHYYQMSSNIGSYYMQIGKERALNATPASVYHDRRDSFWGTATPGEAENETGDYGAVLRRWVGHLVDSQNFDHCIRPEEEGTDPVTNPKVTPYVERIYVMLSSGPSSVSEGSDLYNARKRGSFSICSEKEEWEVTPIPTPGNPCIPRLDLLYHSDGGAVDGGVSGISNCQGLRGWNLYQSTGAGTYKRIASLPVGAHVVIGDMKLNEQRTYRASTLDDGCDESAMSDAATVLHDDLRAPAAPSNVTATAGASSILVTWDRVKEWDVDGYRVSVGETAGGPYSQVHTGLLSSLTKELSFQAAGGGKTYYVIVNAIDLAGNESAASTEVSVTVP